MLNNQLIHVHRTLELVDDYAGPAATFRKRIRSGFRTAWEQLMKTYPAILYTTHNYVRDYRHLDKSIELDWSWSDLSRCTEDSEEDETAYTHIIQVNGEHDYSDLVSVLSDHFGRGCACERDCCGHPHGGIRKVIKTAKPGLYLVRLSYSPRFAPVWDRETCRWAILLWVPF